MSNLTRNKKANQLFSTIITRKLSLSRKKYAPTIHVSRFVLTPYPVTVRED